MNWITVLGIILIAVGTYLSIIGQNKSRSKDILQLNTTIQELKTENKEMIDGKNQLLKKIDQYQDDLNVKDGIIRELEKKAKKTERGISSIYDFRGIKRMTNGPGQFKAIVGPEREIFQKIQKYEKNRNYQELIRICEKQIKDTPDWLTPYLYLGIGYSNINQKEKAIKFLEYVLEKAPDDPNYIQAKEFLEKLKK